MKKMSTSNIVSNRPFVPKLHREDIDRKSVEIDHRHVSVGAIPVREAADGKWEVLVHYFGRGVLPSMQIDSEELIQVDDVYKLMTETPVEGENLSTTVLRGLREELGVTGTVYSRVVTQTKSVRPWYVAELKGTRVFEKTTSYHLVTGIEECGGRQIDELEGKSKVVWVEINELIARFEEQGNRYPNLPDGNEAEPLRRALEVLEWQAQESRESSRLAKSLQR